MLLTERCSTWVLEEEEEDACGGMGLCKWACRRPGCLCGSHWQRQAVGRGLGPARISLLIGSGAKLQSGEGRGEKGVRSEFWTS